MNFNLLNYKKILVSRLILYKYFKKNKALSLSNQSSIYKNSLLFEKKQRLFGKKQSLFGNRLSLFSEKQALFII